MSVPECDPPTFYMTAEGSHSDLPDLIEEAGAPVMDNAVGYHGKQGFTDSYDGFETQYVIDSGGYTAMDKYGGEFPWTVKEYDEWLADLYDENRFQWAAVMDFACEEDFDDVLSVEERMDRTLENTIEHFNHDPDYPVLPVLQGRTIEEYVEFYDRLEDHGIPTEYLGLGTVCRLSSSREIAQVEQAVRARTGVTYLHGFGVKISSFNVGAVFDSADSQAWSWKMKFGLEYYTDGEDANGIPNLCHREYGDAEEHAEARRRSFSAYYNRASALHQQAFEGRKTWPTSVNDY